MTKVTARRGCRLVNGASVRAREGFYVASPEPDTPKTRDKHIGEALASPLELTGVLMSVKLQPPETADTKSASADGKISAAFVTNIPLNAVIDRQRNNAIDLVLVALALGKDGKVKGDVEYGIVSNIKPEKLETLMQVGVNIKGTIEVPAETYNLHVAVRDNQSGNIGTVNLPLQIK